MHAFAEAWPDRGIVQQLAAQIPCGTVTSVKALTSVRCSLITSAFGAFSLLCTWHP